MISARTIGVFLIACAGICVTIAIERYYSSVATAEAIAEQLEGVEFDSVSLPMVSKVCGFAGLVMLVAGGKLVVDSLTSKTNNPDDGLLQELPNS